MAKRPSVETWLSARQQWEADPAQTHESIAKMVGVTRAAVQKRADKEKWERPQSLRDINRKAQLQADKKVALQLPEVAGVTGKNTEQAAIDVRSAVLESHRKDWIEHRRLFTLQHIAEDFNEGKKAKISAEMTILRQRGERAAYGLEDAGGSGGSYEEFLKSLTL